jgi:hypothetical protein
VTWNDWLDNLRGHIVMLGKQLRGNMAIPNVGQRALAISDRYTYFPAREILLEVEKIVTVLTLWIVMQDNVRFLNGKPPTAFAAGILLDVQLARSDVMSLYTNLINDAASGVSDVSVPLVVKDGANYPVVEESEKEITRDALKLHLLENSLQILHDWLVKVLQHCITRADDGRINSEVVHIRRFTGKGRTSIVGSGDSPMEMYLSRANRLLSELEEPRHASSTLTKKLVETYKEYRAGAMNKIERKLNDVTTMYHRYMSEE